MPIRQRDSSDRLHAPACAGDWANSRDFLPVLPTGPRAPAAWHWPPERPGIFGNVVQVDVQVDVRVDFRPLREAAAFRRPGRVAVAVPVTEPVPATESVPKLEPVLGPMSARTRGARPARGSRTPRAPRKRPARPKPRPATSGVLQRAREFLTARLPLAPQSPAMKSANSWFRPRPRPVLPVN